MCRWQKSSIMRLIAAVLLFGAVAYGQQDVTATLVGPRQLRVQNNTASPKYVQLFRSGLNAEELRLALSSFPLSPWGERTVSLSYDTESIGEKEVSITALWSGGSTTAKVKFGEKVSNTTARATPSASRGGEPVQLATGEFFTDDITDFDLGGPLPLRFVRRYAARGFAENAGGNIVGLGRGWTHNFNSAIQSIETNSLDVIHWTGLEVAFTNDGSWRAVAPNRERFQLREDSTGDFWFLHPDEERVYHFDYDGSYARLTTVFDRSGNSLALRYNGPGDYAPLVEVTDGLGRTLTITIPTADETHIHTVSDGSRDVHYCYTNNLLVAITNIMGAVTRYAYTSNTTDLGYVMVHEQKPRGNILYTQTIDAQGRVSTQTDAHGNEWVFEYNTPETNVTRLTPPTGAQFHYAHDNGAVARIVQDPSAAQQTADYDDADRLTTLTNRLGNGIGMTYDPVSGNVASVDDLGGGTHGYIYGTTVQEFTNPQSPGSTVTFTFHDLIRRNYPDGTSESYARDAFGRVTAHTNRTGAVWQYQYDQFGKVSQITNPLGGIQQFYRFPPSGDMVYMTDTDRGDYGYTYDAYHRLTREDYPDGSFETMTYRDDNLPLVTTLRHGETITYQYDANGLLTNTVLPDGHESYSRYDAMDHVTEHGDSIGPLATLAYDAMGRVREITTPAGHTNQWHRDQRGWETNVLADGDGTSLGYDAEGAVTAATSPLGNTVSQQMNALGLPTVISDPMSNTTYRSYDSMGRLVAVTNALGDVTRYTYDDAGRLVSTAIDGVGSNRVERNALGLVTRHTDYDGRVTTYGYTPMGRLTAATNAAGGVTRYEYDTMGRRIRTAFPDGTEEQYHYGLVSGMTGRTDRAGHQWEYEYDAAGRRRATHNPLGGVNSVTFNGDDTISFRDHSDSTPIEYRYDADRRLSEIRPPLGGAVRFAYTNGSRLASLTDIMNNTTRYTYDPDGRLTTVTDPESHATRYVYDTLGRVIAVTNRVGGVTRFDYDAVGNLICVSDPDGVTISNTYTRTAGGYLPSRTTVDGATWQTDYDEMGREVSAQSPLGHNTQFAYDALGNTTSVVDRMSHATHMIYDPMSRLTNVTDPEGRATAYSYDEVGRLASASVTGAGTAHYQREASGAITNITDLNGQDWPFERSTLGRLRGAIDPLGNRRDIIYDDRARIDTITHEDAVVETRTYNGNNNVVNVAYTGGEDYDYTYDSQNRLTFTEGLVRQYDPEGHITNTVGTAADSMSCTASWTPGGRLHTVGYCDGLLAVTYSYDEKGRLTGVADDLTGTAVGIAYDADDRLTAITRPNGVDTVFDVDANDRITRINHQGVLDLQYTLDRAGFVTGCRSDAAYTLVNGMTSAETPDTFDAASRIDTDSDYAHDARGRVTNLRGTTLTWNHANRLTAIQHASYTTDMTYDALGKIMSREHDGVTTRYVYNDAITLSPIAAELNDGGTPLRAYVWTPGGQLLYMIDLEHGNAVYHYHFDRTGNTRCLTDAGGAVVETYQYTPFGKPIGSHQSAIGNPFTFAGMFGVRAEGNLYHMRARYYDPALSRFLSREPIWPDINDPRLINPYQYCRAHPLNAIDATGQTPSDLEMDGGLQPDIEDWFVNTAFLSGMEMGLTPEQISDWLDQHLYRDPSTAADASAPSAQICETTDRILIAPPRDYWEEGEDVAFVLAPQPAVSIPRKPNGRSAGGQNRSAGGLQQGGAAKRQDRPKPSPHQPATGRPRWFVLRPTPIPVLSPVSRETLFSVWGEYPTDDSEEKLPLGSLLYAEHPTKGGFGRYRDVFVLQKLDSPVSDPLTGKVQRFKWEPHYKGFMSSEELAKQQHVPDDGISRPSYHDLTFVVPPPLPELRDPSTSSGVNNVDVIMTRPPPPTMPPNP